MSSRILPILFATMLCGAVSNRAQATQNVTAMNTISTSGSPSTAEGYTYENNERMLSGFSTATNNYGVASLANNVFVRRTTAVPNQSSVWYANGTGANLSGTHQNNYGNMLLSNSVLSGSDNTFANVGTNGQFGNIERIDFTWNSGLTVSNALAFAVFDRGAPGAHDGFGIAAITAIDASGNPTAFGSLLKIASGWGGATNPIADFGYHLFRYANGDDITASTANTEVGTQGVGGIVISAAELGLINGTRVYGYALMGIDVTATNSAQLLDWTDASVYPTNTDSATGGGGIDLASFNGFQIVVVPEPVAWPAILLVGSVFAGCNLVRARRSQRAR